MVIPNASQESLLRAMENAGYRLPRRRYSLHEARIRLNPKTQTMWYLSDRGHVWSYDRLENHFDVLSRRGTYQRVSLEGRVLGERTSTLPFPK